VWFQLAACWVALAREPGQWHSFRSSYRESLADLPLARNFGRGYWIQWWLIAAQARRLSQTLSLLV
jgi:hypothetical protein